MIRIGEIYCIENTITGKKYVGQTMYTLGIRWEQHKQDARRVKTHLYDSMRKYGVENFKVFLLEKVEDTQLNEKEIYWVKKLGTFDNGYNMTLGGGYTYNSKEYLTKEKVESIINLLEDVEYSILDIKVELGVTKDLIYQILRGLRFSETWDWEGCFRNRNREKYGDGYSKNYPRNIQDGEVLRVMELLNKTELKEKHIAEIVGVTEFTVNKIRHGENYNYMWEEPNRRKEDYEKSQSENKLKIQEGIELILKGEKTLKEISKITGIDYMNVIDLNTRRTHRNLWSTEQKEKFDRISLERCKMRDEEELRVFISVVDDIMINNMGYPDLERKYTPNILTKNKLHSFYKRRNNNDIWGSIETKETVGDSETYNYILNMIIDNKITMKDISKITGLEYYKIQGVKKKNTLKIEESRKQSTLDGVGNNKPLTYSDVEKLKREYEESILKCVEEEENKWRERRKKLLRK